MRAWRDYKAILAVQRYIQREVLYFLDLLPCVERREIMTRNSTLRAALAFLMFVLGSLQAWDSDVHEAGLLIVLLVSLAIPLPPLALLIPLDERYSVGAVILSLILLVLARSISPIPLPGLFLVLAPGVMGLIFAGLRGEGSSNS
jgi:hypothetical protein